MTTYALTVSGATVHTPGPIHNRTACGSDINRTVDTLPAGAKLCGRCQARTRNATCPVCGGTVPVRRGLVAPHREQVVTTSGIQPGAEDCDGAGQAPADDEEATTDDQ